MLAGFLVVFLVEAAYQVLENGTHGVVVQAGQFDGAVIVLDRVRAEIDVGREVPGDQGSQSIAL